jgi:hypothetical protein
MARKLWSCRKASDRRLWKANFRSGLVPDGVEVEYGITAPAPPYLAVRSIEFYEFLFVMVKLWGNNNSKNERPFDCQTNGGRSRE